MTHSKLLSLLGMCRRAGRLHWGHDTCLASIRSGKARICLLSSDASDRLRREFHSAATCDGRTLKVIDTPYTMQQIQDATGCFAGVLITEDDGFAARMATLFTDESREGSVNDQ